MPLRAAASAVTWAANGVDLREPLNPAEPADSQHTTLPSGSVIVTIVLLNEVLMWAIPYGTFFLTRRRASLALSWLRHCSGPHFGVGALRLPATLMRFGPLRPRALVFVRWPRTGRPRRWRRPR